MHLLLVQVLLDTDLSIVVVFFALLHVPNRALFGSTRPIDLLCIAAVPANFHLFPHHVAKSDAAKHVPVNIQLIPTVALTVPSVLPQNLMSIDQLQGDPVQTRTDMARVP